MVTVPGNAVRQRSCAATGRNRSGSTWLRSGSTTSRSSGSQQLVGRGQLGDQQIAGAVGRGENVARPRRLVAGRPGTQQQLEQFALTEVEQLLALTTAQTGGGRGVHPGAGLA